MNKRVFALLITLMSLSLIGIIFVQANYINNAVENEKERFTFNVKKALSYVSNTIETNEIDKYFSKYQSLDKDVKGDSIEVSQLFIYQQNNNTNETFIYKSDFLEENHKLSSSLFDIGLDSIDIKNIIGSSQIKVYKGENAFDKDLVKNPILNILNSGRLKTEERNYFNKNLKAYTKTIPISKRVTPEEINDILSLKLKENDIDIDYEFAVYNNGLVTKVCSADFQEHSVSTYSVPLFYDENNKSVYKLLVNFPEDDKFILSSVLGMMFLSIVFTLIIILAYGSSLYQLVKQRKISQIKTDFINNMTHEFKTPIATINLALDAIRNPKMIDDKEKVLRYLRIIKDENKRMNAQVENVLRISKLEKNELKITKSRVDLHDLIEDAITHVQLLVEDKNGYIKLFLDAKESSIMANDMHFTNVIVNILDNAIKYSPDIPKIEVFTKNVGANIFLKIKDYGSGMSKAALKRVFEKFYREHTGNIHNVKGHGLGLAYVKKIVDDHDGYITVESEKGKGSTFTIKLSIIS